MQPLPTFPGPALVLPWGNLQASHSALLGSRDAMSFGGLP